MNPGLLLSEARRAAGLSQDELAERAGTSRPTLSSYEHGHRSPTLTTAARILSAAGFTLSVVPIITFHEHAIARGRSVAVPSRLPRLGPEQALDTVTLPIHLHWSGSSPSFDLRDRNQRARVYEIVLREGTPDDILTYVDGTLLVDVWDEIVLPSDIREAWTPLIEHVTAAAA